MMASQVVCAQLGALGMNVTCTINSRCIYIYNVSILYGVSMAPGVESYLVALQHTTRYDTEDMSHDHWLRGPNIDVSHVSRQESIRFNYSDWSIAGS